MKKKINIVDVGRLGNCIFRYIKAILVCLEDKNFEYYNNYQQRGININENNLHLLKSNKKFFTLNHYFQHEISKENKEKIINYIKDHPEHYLLTDGGKGYHYPQQKYYIKDLIYTPLNFNKFYDLVIHIRLEDKVELGIHIKCNFILKIIDKIIQTDIIDYNNVAIVCLEPKKDFEKNYINSIRDHFKVKTGKILKIESNDIIEDFHIIKNAKNVICSLSTLSWAACMISDKLEKCYFPDWELGMPCFDHGSVTFRNPIDNTIKYDIK